MEKMNNRVALITGSSRGIGRGIALSLAEAGIDVVVNYRSSRQEAEEVVRAVHEAGRNAILCQADVSSRQAVEEMFMAAKDRFGHIDIVVANAGINIPGKVVDVSWSDVRRVLEVSQFGVFHTCQMGAQQMLQQKAHGREGGKILIISSIHAQVPVESSAAYNMAKAGIDHFARTLALELAPHHINVNTINPGRIDTPSTRSFFGDQEKLHEASKQIPWQRVGTPEEIGQAVVYLASEKADYITGASLVIDGGFSIFQNISMDNL